MDFEANGRPARFAELQIGAVIVFVGVDDRRCVGVKVRDPDDPRSDGACAVLWPEPAHRCQTPMMDRTVYHLADVALELSHDPAAIHPHVVQRGTPAGADIGRGDLVLDGKGQLWLAVDERLVHLQSGVWLERDKLGDQYVRFTGWRMRHGETEVCRR